MGCDIHLHVEIKPQGFDHWLHWDQPEVNRFYELFTKMAGVRGMPEDAIALPKGLPKDISESTRYAQEQCRWQENCFSYSWLDQDELIVLCDWLENQEDLTWEKCFGYNCHPRSWPCIRFVFWFDD